MHPSVTTLAYLDCFSGISGDMLLGALLHAGLKEKALLEKLAGIRGIDFKLSIENQLRSGISCKQVTIHSPSAQQFRHLKNILDLLENSNLSEMLVQKASAIFTRLAEAEAKVHNVAVDQIHFHEVGAVDTIVDIVGSLIGLEELGIEKIVCSPLPMGQGSVRCAHGNLPLPAPAVCELLLDTPVYGVDQEKELITPTGAVLATGLASSFGKIPAMTVKAIGYGAGNHTLNGDQPNLLRLIVGEAILVQESDVVEVIETNLDDWNSEGFPYLCDRLFARGALDISLSPLIMKKGRPGQLLRVICEPVRGLELKQIILSETTAIGVRFRKEERMTLPREKIMVSTPWGEIVAKKVHTPEGTVIYPEYEACREVAEKNQIPLARVYRSICGTEER
ncbi:TIGR00299 family protein [Desulfocapsa sulfexigens DSM 10523]|uniref:Putative nickel insertion protein n=1 Tax=Desulfocapsa sulfexigens (strain DSM 10523 / SB164P1) TaxID=1167006 RepID=M1NC93_DESSD|nr:nickel pincer cofactor biosynthesis protein LarC [Desulfocapsa sulfexigens]AGF77399.1 TIGR00299 family protein [Desulfocapsa sulfexigens DSM 10523]